MGTGYVRATVFLTRAASPKHVSPRATVRLLGLFFTIVGGRISQTQLTPEVGIADQDTRQRERGCCACDGLVHMLARAYLALVCRSLPLLSCVLCR